MRTQRTILKLCTYTFCTVCSECTFRNSCSRIELKLFVLSEPSSFSLLSILHCTCFEPLAMLHFADLLFETSEKQQG